MWAPSNGLDSGLMLTPLKGRLGVELVPDHELIVVATRGELAIITVPPETANFLLMTNQLPQPLIRRSDISMIYQAISGARGKDMIIPGKGPHSSAVSVHCS